MRIVASLLGVAVGGGGVTLPIAFGSGIGSNLPEEWRRYLVDNTLLFDCKDTDSHYQVKLAFDEENSSGDALYDLFFDFIDVKTGERVDQLGPKFKGIKGSEKFQLIINGIKQAGKDNWGVSLQTKLTKRGTLRGDWVSLTCDTRNLEVVTGKTCDSSGMCQLTIDFQKIKFQWKKDDKDEKTGWIKQGLEVASGNDLKLVDSFKPKAIFTNH